MKKFWLALTVFLLWAVFALLFHQFFSNSICGECATAHSLDNKHVSKEKKVESNADSKISGFIIKNSLGDQVYEFDKGYKTNSKNGLLEISQELAGLQDSIYNYLNQHLDQEVLIQVKYLATEVDSINNIHLGKSRVQFLSDLLIDAGINPDRLTFQTLPGSYNYDSNGEYNDGISMQFQTISKERSNQIEAGISHKTLYADFAQAEFKPDKTLMAYTIELKNYLDKYSDKKIVVTGHTDSVGVNNYQWGLERATNVKNYLVAQGISTTIIQVVSKGETEPIASNLTEEGRSKNRRIVIIVK